MIPPAELNIGTLTEWIVICDFDGTISREDVTDGILERFALPGWRELESAWQRGDIGSAACMKGQVELIDASPAELDSYLDTVEIDEDFKEFHRELTSARVPLVIASDGLELPIRRILQRHGLEWLPVISNYLIPIDSRRWKLQTPFSHPGCPVASATCKCVAANRLRSGWRRVLLIGDGRSDFCVARAADHVLAKGRLADHCATLGIPHTPIRDFSDAIRFLPQLTRLAMRPFSHSNDSQEHDSHA